VRKWWAAAGVAVVVLALVATGVVWWLGARGTELEKAVAMAPAGSQRLSWTDWAAVRERLGSSPGSDPSAEQLQQLMDDGYDADLTSTSALLASAETLRSQLGFSPATLEWELFTQSERGAADYLRFPDDADLDALGDKLEALGFTRPDEEDGVWRGGTDVLARVDGTLTPELGFFAIDADRHLVVTSDTADYLAVAMDTVAGDADPVDGLDDVVSGSGEPLTAAVYAGAYACSALAMSSADQADQARAEQLVEDAGEVNPVTGFAMSVQPGGDVRVVLGFESEDQARTNADSRSVLARGPAPGQGGDFTDRFTVRSVTADGDVVTLDLDPLEGQYVVSDLSSGPVLFATC
jgi:hypothetical protein